MSSKLSTMSWETFRGEAKTFSMAARFFDRALLESTAKLYFWCRFCDDVIDEGAGDVVANLSELRRLSELVGDDNVGNLPPPFKALRQVLQEHNVPSVYPLDLLDGMAMDAHHKPIEDLAQLELYSYRVASTVGLMMTHITGIFDEEALTEAAHLGMAMQLTNIARDVAEDHMRGRVYLPGDWLREAGLTAQNFMVRENRRALFTVVKRLVAHAETFYHSGLRGIRHLPLRPAFAIVVALYLYRDIGRRIVALGPKAMDSRMVVPNGRKMILTLLAIGHVLRSIPERVLRPRRPVAIHRIWRLT